jgi:hypothetical protein
MEALSDGHAPVLVWGGGSGGIAAALQAARAGADTVLLTPGPWLGGMVSAAGVCAPDGNELTPWQTGLWGALLRALALEEPTGLDHNWVSCFAYRPASAERILRRWLAAESRLRWWPCCRLLEVQRSGRRIQAVRVQAPGPSGRPGACVRLSVGVVIDGSDRGDLFPLAAAPFRFGWEPRERWQEPSAPPAADLAADPFFQQQPVQSPTWVAMARLAEPDPLLTPPPPVAPQAEAAPAPVLPPPFEGACERFGLERTLRYGRLPGGAVMLNWPVHGNDWHGGLSRAFEGTSAADFPATSAEIELAAAMGEHSLAFARALGQASGGALRLEGLFPTAAAARSGALEGLEPLALMPYWREGRRLQALDLVLEQHLLPQGPGACIAPLPRRDGQCQAIAVGNYANDHHYPGPDWPLAAKSCRWGGRWSGTPFTIPYGALVSEAVENLLAADKCLGVSHMANGATRLQPLVLNIGQAAGQAAALALAADLPLAALPVGRLHEALIADPHAPASPLPLWDLPWHHPQRAERQRLALADPSRLGPDGCLVGLPDPDAPAPWQSPPEPGEALWDGTLRPDGDGGYGLETAGGVWPLITLEPALHRWLLGQERSRPVRLIGCANPWGPWLRVSRLAERP